MRVLLPILVHLDGEGGEGGRGGRGGGGAGGWSFATVIAGGGLLDVDGASQFAFGAAGKGGAGEGANGKAGATFSQ